MKIESRDKLAGFLEVARSGGEFDSEGQFTLNRHKAAGKLAAFLLPPGGYWLLKLVQAACIAQACSLEVLEGRKTIMVSLSLERSLDHRAFQKSLLEADLEETWRSQLAQGLRALGVGEERSWVGILEGRGETTQLACSSGQLSTETYPNKRTEPGCRLKLTAEVATPEHYPEADLLFCRAPAASVPLTVNGVRTDNLQFPSEQRGECVPLGVRWVVSPQANRLKIPPGVRQRGCWNYVPAFTVNSRVNRMMAAYFHYRPVNAGASVSALPTESSFSLVRHGVVVTRRSLALNHGISVDLFLHAEDSWMDLSGLRADPPMTLLDNAEEELTAFNGSLRDLGRQMSERRWRPGERQLLQWCGVGFASTLVSPLLLPVVGFGAVGWALNRLRRDHQIRHRASDSLQAFRKDLPLVIRRS